MNFKTVLLSLIIITPVFADLGEATKTAEIGMFKDAKSKVIEVIESAKSGDAKAQLKYGMMLTKGIFLKKDPVAAIGWWKKSAEQDNIKAQLLLGTVYLAGQRVDKDLVKSDRWFNKAIGSSPNMEKAVNIMKSRIAEMEKH